MEPVDLLQNRHILPAKAMQAPKVRLQTELWNSRNASPEIMRSTLTKCPETETILKKCRLPLGIMIHPFKDLSHLPVSFHKFSLLFLFLIAWNIAFDADQCPETEMIIKMSPAPGHYDPSF